MRRIRLIHDDEEIDTERWLDGLWRMEWGDTSLSVEHGFNGRWAWGRPGRGWYAEFHPREHRRSWAYVYGFDDGTRGVSLVAEVNEALAALGCRVDPEVEDPPVPVEDRYLDTLLREVRRPVVRTTNDNIVYAFTDDLATTNHWSSWVPSETIRWTPGPTWTIDDDWSIRYTEDDRF